LNPSLLRLVTPPEASFDLHLPGGMAALYQQRIAAIPEAHRNAWRYHRVASEDTLASVALKYRVAAAELAAANHMRTSDSIAGVEALLVPAAPIAEPAHTRIYTVRRGDTLVTIADRFGVSLNELRRWNKIPGIKVQPGQRLRVAEPAAAPHSASTHHSSGAHTQTAPGKGAAAKPAARSGAATGAKKSGRAAVNSSSEQGRGANTKISAKK
jgi:membrane-bound lytic murein transglycosylase D